MIKIKSFTEIFTTDEDKKAFVKLLDMLFCRRKLNTYVVTSARGLLRERSTHKKYAETVNDAYETVNISTDATGSGDNVDALSQSTGIDKLTLYDLYFRRLSAKHSVDNPSLLTDGIQKMLECKTADELNTLGIKTFGDEWPVSGSASTTITTLRGKSTGVYKMTVHGFDMPLFSSPMPYPELYKDVPKDDLNMYASDLTIALVMLFSIHEDVWRGHNTTPLWSTKDNKLLRNIILKGEDNTEFSTDYIRDKLKPFEHLLFLCLVDLRRSEACDSVPEAALDALELGEYMLDHGFGEEYIHMAMHCNCWGTASYEYITNLRGDQRTRRGFVRGIGIWACTLHIDSTFTEHYSLQNTSVVKNILVPLIKEKPIQPCIVDDSSFRLSTRHEAETEACALLDVSLQDALTKKAMLAILMQEDLDGDPEDIPKCRITCRGALPLFYAGCDSNDWGYDIINGDTGYRCYRGFKSVGSIISNSAFNPHDINDDKFLFPGRDVIDGLPVLLQLQALCEGFFYMDSSRALLEDRLMHPHGLGLEQTELGRSVLDGASRLILAIRPGKVYDLGTYISAGLKPVLVFIEHDISDDKYFLCVETEEQKKVIEDIVQEATKNSDHEQIKLNCLIHVCGRTTDEVWMAGSTFFKCEPVMSSDLSDSPGTLTHELLCQTTLLSIMTFKYLDSLLDSSDKDACRDVLTALEDSSTCADIEMVLCAATETDNQMKEYASDNIDLEEHFVCATGDATPDVDGGDVFQGHIMRRRGHCYISTACLHLNLDGTLNVEIPTKGIYFVSICAGIRGAFYVSDGYMKMLTLTELQGLVPSLVPLCNDIRGMNTQEKKRLCVSLRGIYNENTIFEEE